MIAKTAVDARALAVYIADNPRATVRDHSDLAEVLRDHGVLIQTSKQDAEELLAAIRGQDLGIMRLWSDTIKYQRGRIPLLQRSAVLRLHGLLADDQWAVKMVENGHGDKHEMLELIVTSESDERGFFEDGRNIHLQTLLEGRILTHRVTDRRTETGHRNRLHSRKADSRA